MTDRAESLLEEIASILRANRPAREIMRVLDAADYLGIKKSHLGNLKATYQIPFSKVGGRVVFRKKDLDEWLDMNTVRTAEDDRRLLDGRRKLVA